MRVKDATYSIYFGLKRLPWHPAYLAAMWVMGGELRSLYADWIGADEIPLLERRWTSSARSSPPANRGRR